MLKALKSNTFTIIVILHASASETKRVLQVRTSDAEMPVLFQVALREKLLCKLFRYYKCASYYSTKLLRFCVMP
jgi:hypothetical protein